jgi:hypothetical protein
MQNATKIQTVKTSVLVMSGIIQVRANQHVLVLGRLKTATQKMDGMTLQTLNGLMLINAHKKSKYNRNTEIILAKQIHR